jgi:general secretion pathway protein L
VSTCFLFLNTSDTETALPERLWAVRLDAEGDVETPLALHALEDIKALQLNTRTVVVLPTSVASIHALMLPKLSSRKAREAIPYALEEELAEAVTDVHVAFEQDTQAAGQYRVVVLNKLRLRTWIHALEEQGILFDAITLDWFALAPGELCATDTDLLVHQEDVCGALSPLLAIQYLKTQIEEVVGFSFDDSAEALRAHGLLKSEGSYRLFVAKRLHERAFLNLCQGDFQRTSQKSTQVRWYTCAALLFGIWFISVLSVNGFLLHKLHVQEKAVDTEIAGIYHVFFPDSERVISPRFRVESALKSKNSHKASAYWRLLDTLALVFKSHPLDIERIQFRDETLWVRVVAPNFAKLEAFEQALKKHRLDVKQTEASTRDNRVVSTLELRI